jgi:hypothetical protein
MSHVFKRISNKISKFFSFLKHEASFKKVWKPVVIGTVPSALIFLLIDNLLLPVTILGFTLSVLVWGFHTKKRENIFLSAALADLLLSAIFIIRHVAIILYAQMNLFWVLVSAGFVGNFSYVITLPLVAITALIMFFVLQWTKVWYLEQQTNQDILRTGEVSIEKKIKIPALITPGSLIRKRLKFSIPKVPSRLNVLLQESKLRLKKTLYSIKGILGFAIHATAIRIKSRESKLGEKSRSLIFKFEGLKGFRKSLKSSITRCVTNAIWTIRLIVFKITCMIHWRFNE